MTMFKTKRTGQRGERYDAANDASADGIGVTSRTTSGFRTSFRGRKDSWVGEELLKIARETKRWRRRVRKGEADEEEEEQQKEEDKTRTVLFRCVLASL